MGLFKEVRKPLIRPNSASDSQASSLRPRYAPKAAPCALQCPIGCDARGMLSTIADAEADGRTPSQALEISWQRIAARNPFPSLCGRICARPCEDSCHRLLKDSAVAVAAVERFVGDFAIERGLKFSRAKELPASVAVAGAGPAGLSAAYHLARRGYRVTLLESFPQPGGILRASVPDQILDAEIARILDLGVDLKCGGGEIDAAALRESFAEVVETSSLDPSEPSALAFAIAAGLAAAEEADARIRGVPLTPPPPKAAVPKERMRPDWYKDQPRFDGPCELTAQDAVVESRRCMSCGMCMGCGNCWMYCTKGGFESIPSARRYRLNLTRCNGCGKCSDCCPSGYIDMV